MFCGKCGASNGEGAVFCSSCGAKIDVGKPVVSSGQTSNVEKKKKGIFFVILLAIVVAAVAMFFLGGRSYEKTIEQYVNAQFKVDAEAIFELLPEEVVNYTLRKSGYSRSQFDKLVDGLNDEIQNQLDYIERYLGSDWEVSHEIVSVEDIKNEELKDLKEKYKDFDVDVSAAKNLEILLTVKVGETESSNTMRLSVIKVKRSWYLDIDSMGSFF